MFVGASYNPQHPPQWNPSCKGKIWGRVVTGRVWCQTEWGFGLTPSSCFSMFPFRNCGRDSSQRARATKNLGPISSLCGQQGLAFAGQQSGFWKPLPPCGLAAAWGDFKMSWRNVHGFLTQGFTLCLGNILFFSVIFLTGERGCIFLPWFKPE